MPKQILNIHASKFETLVAAAPLCTLCRASREKRKHLFNHISIDMPLSV